MQSDPPANVRADSFFLIRAHSACPHCEKETAVTALALPRAHQWRDEDAPNAWYRANAPAVLFHVSHLAPVLAAAIAARTSAYRPLLLTGDPADEALWCNHCEHCRHPMEDEVLHSEPGGAFMPLGFSAGALVLERIDAAFLAHAGGYAPDPPCYPEFPAG